MRRVQDPIISSVISSVKIKLEGGVPKKPMPFGLALAKKDGLVRMISCLGQLSVAMKKVPWRLALALHLFWDFLLILPNTL